MNGTDARGQTYPRPLIAPMVTLGPTTLKPDKSHKKFSTRCGLALCQSLGGDEFKRAQPRGVVVNVRDDDQLVSARLRGKRVHARTNRAW
jgi:hypothetical protein